MEGRTCPHRHAGRISCRRRSIPAFMASGHTRRAETSMYPASEVRRLQVGHGRQSVGVHRLQRVRRGLPGGEQHSGRRQGPGGSRPRNALAADRSIITKGPPTRPDALPSAGDVHALRAGAVRAGVPRGGDDAQRRGPQRNDVQPLRRHAVLLEQLPVQSAAVQFLRLQRRAATKTRSLQLAAESRMSRSAAAA